MVQEWSRRHAATDGVRWEPPGLKPLTERSEHTTKDGERRVSIEDLLSIAADRGVVSMQGEQKNRFI